MAIITLTIPDAVLPRVLDAFAIAGAHDPAGGQTKAQFAKSQILQFIKETVKNVEGRAAETTARAQALAAVDTDIQLS